MIQPEDLAVGDTVELDAHGHAVWFTRVDADTFIIERHYDGTRNTVATLRRVEGKGDPSWRVETAPGVVGLAWDAWEDALRSAMDVAGR